MRLSPKFFELGVRVVWALALVALAYPLALSRAADSRDAAERQEQAHAEKLLLQLDDGDGDVRKSAALQLNSLGPAALVVIENAIKAGDVSPEQKVRLEVAAKIIRPRAVMFHKVLPRQAWERKCLYDAYSVKAPNDPEKVAAGKGIIDQYLALGLEPSNGPKDKRDAIMQELARNLDNPFARFLYVVVNGKATGYHQDPVVDEGLAGAFRNVVSGAYSPGAKTICAIAYSRVGKPLGFPMQNLDKIFAETAAMKDLPPGELDVLLEHFYDAGRGGFGMAEEWERWLKVAEQVEPNGSGPLIQRARELIFDSSEARQVEVAASAFTEDRVKAFNDATTRAIPLLVRAWELDHSDSQAARLIMIDLKLRGGRAGNGQEFETWYRRAMEAEPDNFQACRIKMDYIVDEPADPKELITFGRELLAGENWRAGLPFMLVDAHERAADASADRVVYFQDPAVWKDICDVYEGMLINFPRELRRRCEYAKYATLCGHWDIADKQFKRIGDHPDMTVFVSQTSYDYLRKKAERHAGAPTSAPTSPAHQ